MGSFESEVVRKGVALEEEAEFDISSINVWMYNEIATSLPLLNQYPYGTFGFIEGCSPRLFKGSNHCSGE